IMVSPSATRAASTSEAEARRSEARTAAALNGVPPRTMARRPSILMLAPMRTSSCACMKRFSNIFSVMMDSHPPPAPGTTEQHSFNSVLQMQVSTDGGGTFHSVTAPATVQVQIASLGSATDGLYDTEMLKLEG